VRFCAPSQLDDVAYNQAVVLPTLWHQLDQGDPIAYPDGDVDMVGPDEAGNYALAGCEYVLEGGEGGACAFYGARTPSQRRKVRIDDAHANDLFACPGKELVLLAAGI
jgi:hypothetical protein